MSINRVPGSNSNDSVAISLVQPIYRADKGRVSSVFLQVLQAAVGFLPSHERSGSWAYLPSQSGLVLNAAAFTESQLRAPPQIQEIGIRMALGASAAGVRKMVVWQGMRLAVIGVVIGVGAALGLTRFMAGLIYQVKTWDPTVFV